MANRGGAQRPNGTSQGKICQFKLVLLGESAVGKSSLVLRFVKGQFHEYQESTIGAAFLTQTVCLDETTVKFEIWDTAGQERYHSLAPMYYRGAQAAIVVYDITNQRRSCRKASRREREAAPAHRAAGGWWVASRKARQRRPPAAASDPLISTPAEPTILVLIAISETAVCPSSEHCVTSCLPERGQTAVRNNYQH
ncbi:hypothetical protein LSTR_LSTR011703 [Laodelphax striatellus]|uniref:Uncharacterized protein n=1 Tax=Laodelphax striatellus TaxID=195883 RepID=A0A482WVS0_LAOST|nr:hypothetical protein LSTR_LSTR011703 [Laodelphax striatellus]